MSADAREGNIDENTDEPQHSDLSSQGIEYDKADTAEQQSSCSEGAQTRIKVEPVFNLTAVFEEMMNSLVGGDADTPKMMSMGVIIQSDHALIFQDKGEDPNVTVSDAREGNNDENASNELVFNSTADAMKEMLDSLVG